MTHKARAAAAAQQARAELGYGTHAPIADTVSLVEGGADPVPVAIVELPSDIAGIYMVEREQPFIVVNIDQASVRQRFTTAHEFGHHRMKHGSVIDTGADLTPGVSRHPHEVQANYFAAEFLAPADGIRSWMLGHGEPEVDLEVVVRLWCHFGISAKAALYRLSETGFVRGAAVTGLAQQLVAGQHHGMPRRLGLAELRDSHFDPKRPRVPAEMQQHFIAAYEAGVLELDDLADVLRRDERDLSRELAEEGIEPHTVDDDDL